MTPEDCHLVSQAAYRNACEYLEQSDVLADRGWYGRATALAVLGQEEIGKATYFKLLGLGLLKYKPKAINEMFGKHLPKQRMSQILVVIEGAAKSEVLVAFLRDCLGLLLRSLPAEATEQELRQVLDDLRPRLDAYCAIHPEIGAEFRRMIMPAAEDAWGVSLDNLKLRGLYVDFDKAHGRVRDPTEMTAAECWKQRDALKTKLTNYRDGTPEIPDERTLELLRRLTGAPTTLEPQ